MSRTTFIAHRVSVALMGVIVLVATFDGFAQSYSGLYRWALDHDLKGWKAESFPLLVDLFIAVGELGLFALALEAHRLTRHAMAWFDVALPFTLAAGGWGVSLAFNVGAADRQLSDQLTAAVAPVASMLGLLVLLRTLHRIVSRNVWADQQPSAEPVTERQEREDSDHPALPAAPEVETADESPLVDDTDGFHHVRGARVFADQVADQVADPVAEDVADGYDRWDGMPVVGQAQPSWWPLPALSATSATPVGHLADNNPEPAVDGTVFGHDFSRVADGETAGQTPVGDLASAIRSARAAGMSERQIAREFGVSRYRVSRLLDGDEDDAAAATNGHRPATG